MEDDEGGIGWAAYGNFWESFVDEVPLDDEQAARELDETLLDMDPVALAELVKRAQRRRVGRDIAQERWTTQAELRDLARRLVADAGRQQLLLLRRMVDPDRMCQTQICLTLALHLLKHDMVTSDVTVAVSGREVTRGRPTFDISRFLSRRGGYTGLSDDIVRSPSVCRFAARDRRFGIVTVRDRGEGDVVADVAPGCRLIVYATPGPLIESGTSLERTLLRNAIGNAVSRVDVTPLDLLMVAVPRSPGMCELVKEVRRAPRVLAATLSILTVSRAGAVDGLPLLRGYVPEGLD